MAQPAHRISRPGRFGRGQRHGRTTSGRPRARTERTVHRPTAKLDLEAELGFVVGTPSTLGTPVAADDLAEHVFGVVVVNDWSARDIQALEYVPLGPFLGKSFATTISAWVTPLDALEGARTHVAADADESIAGYLRTTAPWGLDVEFEVSINGTVLSRPEYRNLHWSAAQMLAHTTVNGAAMRCGDLFASGTVSGPSDLELGCLLELTHDGTRPVPTPDGQRGYLEDGDLVVVRARARLADGTIVDLHDAAGRVRPASLTTLDNT